MCYHCSYHGRLRRHSKFFSSDSVYRAVSSHSAGSSCVFHEKKMIEEVQLPADDETRESDLWREIRLTHRELATETSM